MDMAQAASLGVTVFGGVAAFVLLFATISARKPALRLIGMVVYLVPPMWAGAIATRAMAIQTGAEGAFWPLLAGGFGAILFGLMAYARLPAMMEQLAQFRPEPQPEPQPTPRPPPKMEEPEPKVIYYQPMPPSRPKLRDGRGDDDRIIDL